MASKKKFMRPFGVELEGFTTATRRGFCDHISGITGLRVGLKSWQRASTAHDFWTLTTDGSVTHPTREKGDELVSPVLRGENGLKQLRQVLRAMNHKSLGDDKFKTDKSCSVHIHISIEGLDVEDIKKIFYMYQFLEDELHMMFPDSRRENVGRGGRSYCGSVKPYTYEEIRTIGDKKYHAVNFPDNIPTIEFRIHGGSTNYKKISSWIRILDYIISFALDNSSILNWDGRKKKPDLSTILPKELYEYYRERAQKFVGVMAV